MTATTAQEQNALTLPERASVALGESANIAKLRELAAQSAGILSVTNADGRKEAHRAGMVLRETRTNITTTGKAAREDATAFSKAVIALEKELIAIIEPEETRVLALRDAFDEQLAAEKAAKIAAERARTDAIRADIDRIIDLTLGLDGAKPAVILAVLVSLDEIVVDEARFGEFTEVAAKAIGNCKARLTSLHDGAVVHEQAMAEAEKARIAEAARIEAEKAELAAQRAENERIANELAIERKKQADLAAAQEVAAAKLRAEAEANLQAERDAQARVAAESKRQMEAQQAAIAEQSRKLAEQQAAADKRDAEAAQAAIDAAARDADHGPALEMNAAYDAAQKMKVADETERVRLQALAEQAVADAHAPIPSIETLLDQVDAGEILMSDVPIQDSEIIELVAETFGLWRSQAIDRLEQIDFAASRAEVVE